MENSSKKERVTNTLFYLFLLIYLILIFYFSWKPKSVSKETKNEQKKEKEKELEKVTYQGSFTQFFNADYTLNLEKMPLGVTLEREEGKYHHLKYKLVFSPISNYDFGYNVTGALENPSVEVLDKQASFVLFKVKGRWVRQNRSDEAPFIVSFKINEL